MRFRLLQAREAGDVVREEERQAFARRLDVPPEQVMCHDLLADPAAADRVCDGVDAILVGGSGTFSVYDDWPWVRAFIDLVGALAESGKPMFASCFGFQALVVAAGGVVAKDEARAEVGTFGIDLLPAARVDPLFSQLPPHLLVQLGHKDHAVRWPEALVLLARSERCPFQALTIPGRPVYGTQFHPELTGTDNLQRFMRYRDSYQRSFGVHRFQEMADGFLPSPEADGLLLRWRREVEAAP